MQGRSKRGCGGATPPTEMMRIKSGKIMKQSGKKYAKIREIRDVVIRKINKIKWRQFFKACNLVCMSGQHEGGDLLADCVA